MNLIEAGFSAEAFFELSEYEHEQLFITDKPVWEAIRGLQAYMDAHVRDDVACHIPAQSAIHGPAQIAADAIIEPGVCIFGPVFIGARSVIRHGAYIRPYSLIGRNCVVGHATEVKHSIVLDTAELPHFNYVGDSIIGRGVDLGAGVKLANVRHDQCPVAVRAKGERVDTGLCKFGAIVGDRVRIGCNAVCCPGTLIGPDTHIYPTALVRGTIAPDSTIKTATGERAENL